MSLTKKCIVFDLDNTLWGGILGEDGIDGIKLGTEKEGRPFLDFQKRILELYERGVILAINSKNNYDDVLELMKKHKYMLLKENNFACMKINWKDKITNMREIASELNIGLDSTVFVDDDKANRELMKEFLPEVMIVELPDDPSLYPKTIESLKVFNLFSITEEDLKRGEMYYGQRKRKVLKEESVNIDDFLMRLQIKVIIKNADDLQIPRLAQLTQKTNQFNLTTKRYSEEELKRFMNSDNYLIKLISVEDKFGDYGVTGLAIIEKTNEISWQIDSLLLSCRILGKKIEFAFMQNLIDEAKKAGVKEIHAEFIPTSKNPPAKDFLDDCGFILIGKNNSEKYKLEIGKEKARELYVEIIENENS